MIDDVGGDADQWPQCHKINGLERLHRLEMVLKLLKSLPVLLHDNPRPAVVDLSGPLVRMTVPPTKPLLAKRLTPGRIKVKRHMPDPKSVRSEALNGLRNLTPNVIIVLPKARSPTSLKPVDLINHVLGIRPHHYGNTTLAAPSRCCQDGCGLCSWYCLHLTCKVAFCHHTIISGTDNVTTAHDAKASVG